MLGPKAREIFNFVRMRLKATQRESLVMHRFFRNLDESKVVGKKPLEKISFKATWRFYKLIEKAPNEAVKLLENVKDERWFDREVIKALRGIVLGLNEETYRDYSR